MVFMRSSSKLLISFFFSLVQSVLIEKGSKKGDTHTQLCISAMGPLCVAEDSKEVLECVESYPNQVYSEESPFLFCGT